MESVRGTTRAFPGFHLRQQEGGRQCQLPFWQLAAALISRKMVWKPQAAASWRVHLLQALSLDQLLWGLLCSWWCHLWNVFHVWDAVFNNNLWKAQNWLLKKASFICHRKSVKLMRYWLDPDMLDTWRMVKVIDQVVKRMLNLCFQLNFSSFSFPSLFYSGFKEWDCRLIALWTNYLTAKGSSHSLTASRDLVKSHSGWRSPVVHFRTDGGSELLSFSWSFFPFNYYTICIRI